MSADSSGSQSKTGAGLRDWVRAIGHLVALGGPRGIARIGVLTALVLGLAFLALGRPAQVQKAGALQAAEIPAAAVVEAAPTAGPEVASVEVATPEPSVSVAPTQVVTPESTSPAALSADLPDARPELTSRSGERAADESELASNVVAVSEKLGNAQVMVAAASLAQSAVMVSRVAVVAVPKPATPKAVVRVAAPTPKPVVRKVAPVRSTPVATSGGSWVELPNVRPIPSAYYAQVHHWDIWTNYWAKYYHVDPDLIRRIIYVESKGYQYAYVGSTGVKGLMQISPMWFKAGENPYDPKTNIGKGAYILNRGYHAYHTWFKAVSYYCYGPLGSTIKTFYASLVFSPIIRGL